MSKDMAKLTIAVSAPGLLEDRAVGNLIGGISRGKGKARDSRNVYTRVVLDFL